MSAKRIRVTSTAPQVAVSITDDRRVKVVRDVERLTADQMLARLLTVDGEGSGLDADLVRGVTPGAAGLQVLALAPGTNGQVLQVVGGAPAWSSLAAESISVDLDSYQGYDDLNAALDAIGTDVVAQTARLDAIEFDLITVHIPAITAAQLTADQALDLVNGLGSLAQQDAASVAITGGTIDGTAIGATTRSSGRFTTLFAESITISTEGTIDGVAIGTSIAEAGRFTTLVATGTLTIGAGARQSFTVTGGGITPNAQYLATGAAASLGIARYSADAFCGRAFFGKSRGASVGAYAATVDGDALGELIFNGSDGTSFAHAATIRASVDGTPSSGFVPGRLAFLTTSSGSTPAERLTIAGTAVTITSSVSSGLTIAATTGRTLKVDSTQASTSTDTGCATFAGGIGVVGQLTVGGTIAFQNTFIQTLTDSTTNTVTDVCQFRHNGGTVSTGFGSAFQYLLETTTTNNINAARMTVEWADATHSSRKARVTLSAYDTAIRECLRYEGTGSAAAIGFLGATAVVRQTIGAAATDAATTQTLANAIRTALINLGLCQA